MIDLFLEGGLLFMSLFWDFRAINWDISNVRGDSLYGR